MKKPSLTRLITLLLLCVCAGVGYVYAYRVVSKTSERLASLHKEANEKSTDAARIAAVKNALRTLVADESSASNYLVLASDIVPFIERLEQMGSDLGADVSVASVSKEKTGSRERLVLSLKITGNFEAVMRTLGAIEYAPYDITTSQVSVGLAGAVAGGTWTASAVFWVGLQSGTVSSLDKK